MTPTLEDRVAGLFGYAHCVLFGRARAGVVAVLDCVGATGRPVVMPSNVCPAVLAAVVAAQTAPLLASVDPRCGLATGSRLSAAMATAPGKGVVMPTHLYGLWSPCADSVAAARADGWFVLENDTLCAAALRDGSRRAVGDALVVSFNMVKTIEAGIGGAVLTDDRALARDLATLACRWPALAAADFAVERDLTLARRHLRALGRESVAEQLLDIDAAHTRHALPDDARPRLLAALEAAPAAIARRRQRLEWWRHELAGLDEVFPEPAAELVQPWRHVRVCANPAQRTAVVDALRAAGFDAGTNFPPLVDAFPTLLAGQHHADSRLWAASVVNLWLTDDYDRQRVAAAAAIIRRILDQGTP